MYPYQRNEFPSCTSRSSGTVRVSDSCNSRSYSYLIRKLAKFKDAYKTIIFSAPFGKIFACEPHRPKIDLHESQTAAGAEMFKSDAPFGE
jgi:hypothetical protein